jgi:Tfp pilus assembly protein PilF
MEMLSDVISARGEFTLGREYATRAAEMMTASFGETSMPVACALANRALIEHRAGNTDAASKDYQQAIRISQTHPEHQDLAAALVRRYADLLKTMHRGREAKALLAPREAKAAIAPVDGPVKSFSLR